MIRVQCSIEVGDVATAAFRRQTTELTALVAFCAGHCLVLTCQGEAFGVIESTALPSRRGVTSFAAGVESGEGVVWGLRSRVVIHVTARALNRQACEHPGVGVAS